MENQTIGHYKLGATIGRGGFAIVRRAIHQPTGLQVAVKVINKERMKNKHMISKVTREVQLLKYINHPNIIKLYEVIDTTTDIYVVMQMAQGELYQYIEKNSFTQDDVRYLFRQIIDGLSYVHTNLISHRDLKPQNILIGINKSLKIADFGLANVTRDGKMLKSCCGSLNYAAPQVISRVAYEGTAVDVWSCGVILFTMLAGSLPFEHETITVLCSKIKSGEYQIPQYVSETAADLIKRMLTVDPIKRIRLFQVKLHPWLAKKILPYSRMPYFYQSAPQLPFVVDLQIFNQIYSYNLPSLKKTKDTARAVKAIQNRLDESFVVAYNLLQDSKCKNDVEKTIPIEFHNIIGQVENKMEKEKIQDDHEFVFGKEFSASPRMLIEIVFYVLRDLGIQFIIKNNRYALICKWIQRKQHKKQTDSEIARSRNHMQNQESHFVKNEGKFILQLYLKKNKNNEVLMDLKLSQGHPLVFMTLSRRIMQKVNQKLQN